MYMPGLFLTASSPSRTVIESALYAFFGAIYISFSTMSLLLL